MKVVFASSSSVYGAAERYPTPEDTPLHGRSRPTGSRSSPASSCRRLRARSSGSTRWRCGTSTPYGPRQRPDMAFTRDRRTRSPPTSSSSSTATARSRAGGRMSPTSSTRRLCAMEAGPASTTSAEALEASMNEALALLESIAERSLRRHVRTAADRRPCSRTKADTSRIRTRARLGAARLAAGWSREALAVGGSR